MKVSRYKHEGCSVPKDLTMKDEPSIRLPNPTGAPPTPRVVLIESPRDERIKMDGIEKYGEVLVLFNRDKRRPPIFKPTEYAKEVVDALQEIAYDPRVDYVCIAGALLPNCLLTASIVHLFSGCRLLMFDANKGEYVEKEFTT